MQIVDISKLKYFGVLYIPKYDINSAMSVKSKVVVAESEDEARSQITNRHSNSKIIECKILEKK